MPALLLGFPRFPAVKNDKDSYMSQAERRAAGPQPRAREPEDEAGADSAAGAGVESVVNDGEDGAGGAHGEDDDRSGAVASEGLEPQAKRSRGREPKPKWGRTSDEEYAPPSGSSSGDDSYNLGTVPEVGIVADLQAADAAAAGAGGASRPTAPKRLPKMFSETKEEHIARQVAQVCVFFSPRLWFAFSHIHAHSPYSTHPRTPTHPHPRALTHTHTHTHTHPPWAWH